MRESNHSVPANGRAAICVQSGVYDRRALDAPTASLPLINSLTHLSYLTATSPRIREILAHDGGLERIVRVLKHCAQGGPSSQQAASLADLKGKGKGGALPRASRKSPFKAFAEYDLLPTLDDLRELEESDVDGALLALVPDGDVTGYTYSVPSSLLLPPPSKFRHLVYTYSLAFQCIVNIGVRGNEAIRTRVVEAGAVDVVVFVLQRYLEEIARKRMQNIVEWQKKENKRIARMEWMARHGLAREVEGAAMDVEEDEPAQQQHYQIVPTSASSTSASPVSSVPVSPLPPSPPVPAHIVVPPSTVSRPLLTRLNVVAASSAAASASSPATASLHPPPSRVHTPDTVLSLDDASITGDENGSTSGQEVDADEVVLASSVPSASSSTIGAATRERVKATEDAEMATPVPPAQVADESEDVEMGDADAEVQRRTEAAQPAVPQRSTRRPARPSNPRTRSLPLPNQQRYEPTPRPPQPARAAPSLQPTSSPSPPLRPSDSSFPFREEDVLLSLQLLAYLSKYPHVRHLFHEPSPALAASASNAVPYLYPFPFPEVASSSTSDPFSSRRTVRRPAAAPTNVFSLVEFFTYRPPSDDPFTPVYPDDVQYWAGTIMRNACRKDDARGGIRQCANMLCGKWEGYAREFAKCRRCRRAKYCSKMCQSEAWNQGHRHWCHKIASRRHGAHGNDGSSRSVALAGAADSGNSTPASPAVAAEGGFPPDLAQRRRRHQHQRRRREADDDEDDEDEEELEELPAPPADSTTLHSVATPPPPAPPATNAGAGLGGQRGVFPPGLPPGIATGEEDGMPVGIDEDSVAREMLAGEGGVFGGDVVRVQAN
ncbi:zinc finger, MYND-type protein, regulationof budding-related protein [Rhodotorula toruloides]|uniref:Zinc finger, MYND-type protein, regulationof budding-related protein n=1 Tax=Rhodotorula toruloides TaxID=5286 RepID=A0A511KLR1_RHOTO|nr:zinc finger, MYND-type protein, regulationof budding-related protein [Rhodotorula toruloides]